MNSSIRIPESGLVLFQGDSITDVQRDRTRPLSMGGGYAVMVAGWYLLQHENSRVSFLNRGISGNQARDLRARWKEDALDLKPALLSILVGTNDAWRNFDSTTGRTDAEFEEDLRALLEDSINAGIDKIVLGEPFLLPAKNLNVPFEPMFDDISRKGAVVRRLADEYNTAFVPYATMFAEACKRREPEFWAPDGVHPSPAGHALMAREWLRAVGEG